MGKGKEVRRLYPEKISRSWKESETFIKDYSIRLLSVDDEGNVSNPPPMNGGDHFVTIQRRNDLSCLLKDLPAGSLRDLAVCRRVLLDDGTIVERPRPGRDDLVAYGFSTHRKTFVYGTRYLLGSDNPTVREIDGFVEELSKLVGLRPIVGNVSRFLMRTFLNEDLVRAQGVPKEVLMLFNEHGRGGNIDTSVIGTSATPEVKVDQKTSYMTVMEKLDSPTENVFKGILWVNDAKYDPDDAYGIYCVNCTISQSLVDTPVYKEINGTYVPLVGEITNLVVLKPTMDDIKLLESLGLAKVDRVLWSWRFEGRNRHPFGKLGSQVSYLKDTATYTKRFFKYVACAPWGQTLATYTDFDKAGVPHLVAGYWFNPVIGYTTTDLMRSINFRMKLRAKGLVSAEVIDMLTGTPGDWYKDEKVGLRGPYLYTHINPIYHVSPEDDKLGLLDEIRNCRAKALTRNVKTRYSFEAFRFMGADAKQIFGSLRERNIRLEPDNSKRRTPKEVKSLKISDLLTNRFKYMPYTEEDATEIAPASSWNAALFELTTGTLLDKLLNKGETW